eukprot:1539255-Pyramimonas_sp.AAC.1
MTYFSTVQQDCAWFSLGAFCPPVLVRAMVLRLPLSSSALFLSRLSFSSLLSLPWCAGRVRNSRLARAAF